MPDVLIPGRKYRLAAKMALVQHIVVEGEGSRLVIPDLKIFKAINAN